MCGYADIPFVYSRKIITPLPLFTESMEDFDRIMSKDFECANLYENISVSVDNCNLCNLLRYVYCNEVLSTVFFTQIIHVKAGQ